MHSIETIVALNAGKRSTSQDIAKSKAAYWARKGVLEGLKACQVEPDERVVSGLIEKAIGNNFPS